MKYIIMADGKETRWSNCAGIHKWQIKVDNETLLERTARIVKENDPDASVIVTSHFENLRVKYAEIYAPKNNKIEIDRFTEELIEDNSVFLYGDCFYTEETLKKIIHFSNDSLLFFGSDKHIFAIKVHNAELFKKHISIVKELFLNGKIKSCIGWQVYRSFQGLDLEKNQIANDFILIDDETRDFNNLYDYYEFEKDKPVVSDNRAIAFFDSGVGGLTCVKAFIKDHPNESILYFGDSMRAPYGDRNQEEIKKFVEEISEYLISQNIKLLIVACNTASSLSIPFLRQKYLDTPIIGMIDITDKYISNNYNDKNVGIIATSVTKESGVYSTKLREFGCTKDIPVLACPKFVPLIESGIHDGPKAEAVLKSELDEFITENKIDVLVLGCTHFPFLRPSIEKLYPQLECLDPSDIVAKGVKELMDTRIIAENINDEVHHKYCTSKVTDAFIDAVKNISGNPDQTIELIKF